MKFYYSKWVQNVYPLLINLFASELPALDTPEAPDGFQMCYHVLCVCKIPKPDTRIFAPTRPE